MLKHICIYIHFHGAKPLIYLLCKHSFPIKVKRIPLVNIIWQVTLYKSIFLKNVEAGFVYGMFKNGAVLHHV